MGFSKLFALTLVALPIVGVLNGWFASERWPVTRLAVRAEFEHVSAEQIRAAAEPGLGQGFFAMQLDQVRDAVARLPWVERVEARKRWPDTVELVVYEQQPYAHWSGGRLVNRTGQLFSVPGGELLQGLPRLAGPDDLDRCPGSPQGEDHGGDLDDAVRHVIVQLVARDHVVQRIIKRP